MIIPGFWIRLAGKGTGLGFGLNVRFCAATTVWPAELVIFQRLLAPVPPALEPVPMDPAESVMAVPAGLAPVGTPWIRLLDPDPIAVPPWMVISWTSAADVVASERVVLVRVTLAVCTGNGDDWPSPTLAMPAPWLAVLPVNTELDTETVPLSLNTAPPSPLPLPPFPMPAPPEAELPVSVLPVIVTVPVLKMAPPRPAPPPAPTRTLPSDEPPPPRPPAPGLVKKA